MTGGMFGVTTELTFLSDMKIPQKADILDIPNIQMYMKELHKKKERKKHVTQAPAVGQLDTVVQAGSHRPEGKHWLLQHRSGRGGFPIRRTDADSYTDTNRYTDRYTYTITILQSLLG